MDTQKPLVVYLKPAVWDRLLRRATKRKLQLVIYCNTAEVKTVLRKTSQCYYADKHKAQAHNI
jgi:hypothetical protein